jgi:hypothetical protein
MSTYDFAGEMIEWSAVDKERSMMGIRLSRDARTERRMHGACPYGL